ncbi:MAG: hypothetical protein GX624_05635 [Actinobacteria bacterium]|nr:hypothetical protein [Actinomycetota bacterium]
MTTSGYNPTAMPGPETRFIPRIPDFSPRTSGETASASDDHKAEND